MLAPNCRHTAHCFSISARSAALSGYGMFFWKPKAGAMKLIGMSMASQSASMMAVVSGVVRPGSSSIDSSRRYARPAAVVNACSRAARYLVSRAFIFRSAGQT